MKIRNSHALKTWLEERLERLCEADPAALSKYVLALIQKEKELSDLKRSCTEQLEVFLGGETASFVDSLFSAITSGSYLSEDSSPRKEKEPESEHSDKGSTPRASRSPSVTTSPVAHRRERERRHTEIDDDDRDFKRARRGHSSSSSPSPDRGSSHKTAPSSGRVATGEAGPRTQPGNIINLKQKNTWRNISGRPAQQMNLTMSAPVPNFGQFPRGMAPLLPQHFMKPLRKERCKDFDEKGVCMLGENCPYDHGTDPLVVGTMLPWHPPGGNSTNMAAMSQLRAIGQPGLHSLPNFQPQPVLPGGFPLSTPPLMSTTTADSVADNGYNPDNPGMNLSGLGGVGIVPQGVPGLSGQPSLSGGQGMRPYQRGAKRQRIPTDCLMVRNVPPEKNTITTLSGHFQQFGTIINIRVRFNGDPHTSLVQFSTTEEGQKAFESSEAVLGNRFIKLFYFKMSDGAPRQKRRKEEIFDVTSGVQLALGEALGRDDETKPSVTMGTVSAVTVANVPPSLASSVSASTTTTTGGVLKPSTSCSTISTAPQSMTITSPGVSSVRGNHRPPPVPNKALQAKQAAVSKKMATLQKQLDSLQESLAKKVTLQGNIKGLINKQLETQKSLIGKLDNSKSLSDPERKKAMETLKEMSGSVSKLNEQAQALKSAILKLNKEKQTVEAALGEVGKDLKALKDAETQALEASQQANPVSKSDLRNKINKKKLLVMDVDVEDHIKLAGLFESVGNLLEVCVDPDNGRNLIFTFSKRADAEKAVRSITSFNSKPVIMKWYTSPIPVPNHESKVEMGPKIDSAPSLPSEVVKSPKAIPEPLTLERRKSEIDDLLLLSPGTDSQALLHLGDDEDRVLDDSLLDDEEDEDAESKSWKRQ